MPKRENFYVADTLLWWALFAKTVGVHCIREIWLAAFFVSYLNFLSSFFRFTLKYWICNVADIYVDLSFFTVDPYVVRKSYTVRKKT